MSPTLFLISYHMPNRHQMQRWKYLDGLGLTAQFRQKIQEAGKKINNRSRNV